MRNYKHYHHAELELMYRIVHMPEFITTSTHERLCDGFVLTDPRNNRNDRSNYEYAEEFFQWMMTGQKQLSQRLIDLNPWVQRFTTEKGLPESFSASYGWKIVQQYDIILDELKRHKESRRAYMNILFEEDHIILPAKTTHEYPCTIGAQFFNRHEQLYMIVNMRSNNVYSVMPYDVYNMTNLQRRMADDLSIDVGYFYQQINNAHIFKGDVRRLIENQTLKSNGRGIPDNQY